MTGKNLLSLFGAVVILLIPLFCSTQGNEKDIIYQTSTISALQEGVYDGTVSLNALGKMGNFGIGTYNGLDGEMVVLDGIFYQVRADGKVYRPADSTRSPFAMMTYFDTDTSISLNEPSDLTALQTRIAALFPSRNVFYAIMIEGNFQYVKTRSVPKQSKPYPRLAEAVKNQCTFEFHDIKGTIIGYWLPEYMKGISTPGYHLHFLSSDKQSGGHLLECRMIIGTISLDYTSTYTLDLPPGADFYNIQLPGDRQKELEKIEK